MFCTFFKSSLHYFECVFYLLFQNRIPHRDRQQAVNIVGYGASLNKQEDCDHHCHTRAQPCQVTARNLDTGEKYQLNKTFRLCKTCLGGRHLEGLQSTVYPNLFSEIRMSVETRVSLQYD